MSVIMPHHNRGISLIELLIGIALVAIVLTGATQMLSFALNSQDHMEQKLKPIAIKRILKSKVNCKNIPTTCTLDAPVQVGAKPVGSSAVLIASSGSTKISGWNVRAICGRNNLFRVEIAKFRPDGTFAADPLNKSPLDWGGPYNPLFKEGELCPPPSAAPNLLWRPISGTPCYFAISADLTNSDPQTWPNTYCPLGTPGEPDQCDPNIEYEVAVAMDTLGDVGRCCTNSQGNLKSAYGLIKYRICAPKLP